MNGPDNLINFARTMALWINTLVHSGIKVNQNFETWVDCLIYYPYTYSKLEQTTTQNFVWV
jgi:hypothetical protein